MDTYELSVCGRQRYRSNGKARTRTVSRTCIATGVADACDQARTELREGESLALDCTGHGPARLVGETASEIV